MAISSTVTVSPRAYPGRPKTGLPMGTFHGAIQDAGDGSGGTVTLGWMFPKVGLGVMLLYVPVMIAADDGLSTAESVLVRFPRDENLRLTGVDMTFSMEMRAAGGRNGGSHHGVVPLIEPTLVNSVTKLNMVWVTNTNGVGYIGNVYGYVYDATAWAREPGLVIDGPVLGL